MIKVKTDKILLLTIIILSIFGLFMIYSASSIWADYKFGDSFYYVKYQFLFLVIGLIVLYVVSKINYDYYYKSTKYIVSLIVDILEKNDY